MCTYSMAFDFYGPRWPRRIDPPVSPYDVEKELAKLVPRRITVEDQKTAITLFKKIEGLLKELDEILGLKDCEDPAKGKFLNDIKQLILDHETKKIQEQLGI